MSTTVTTHHLDRLQRELSDRDWQIISTLVRVRVATAPQLEALHFPDVVRRRAQARLAALTKQRVLARGFHRAWITLGGGDKGECL